MTDALDRLQAILGERCSTAESVLAIHGRDESAHPPSPPDAVCFPESIDEVSAVVAICAETRTPVIPFGAGTSVEGHVLATQGGVAIDLTRMNRILAIRPHDLDVHVEAGVTRLQLDKRLGDHGLFFPIDPGADATLGGMAATRASGTNAVRYGTMRDSVLSLTAVMPDSRTIQTSRRARKSSAGYDLTRLLVGSEGTLGVICELTLRVFGLPEAMSSAVVCFDDLAAAVTTVIRTIQYGIPVARIELLDEAMVAAINGYAGMEQRLSPTLMLEFHGSTAAVEEQAREFGEIAAESGGSEFRWATDAQEREKLWEARHHAYFAGLALRPGCRVWSTDVCVPISRLAECILETREDIERSGLVAPLVGHAGDGNFHLLISVDTNDSEEMARADAFHDRLIERSLAMDGTCTGEHGVGIGKRRFLASEHGGALDTMRAIKKALDPLGIMNPGKVFPETDAARPT